MVQRRLAPGPRGARALSSASGGAAWGFTTSSGCGSKVTSTLARPAAAARRAISCSTAWCPRCTPSNEPTVTTVPGATRQRVEGWIPQGSEHHRRLEPALLGPGHRHQLVPRRSTTAPLRIHRRAPVRDRTPVQHGRLRRLDPAPPRADGRAPRAGGCSASGRQSRASGTASLHPQRADRLTPQRGQMRAYSSRWPRSRRDGPQVRPRDSRWRGRSTVRRLATPAARSRWTVTVVSRQLHRIYPAAPAGSCARRPTCLAE